VHPLQQFKEANTSEASRRREIGTRKERLAVGCQKCLWIHQYDTISIHKPRVASHPSPSEHDKLHQVEKPGVKMVQTLHIRPIDVRVLFSVNFDGNKVLIEKSGDSFVFKALKTNEDAR